MGRARRITVRVSNPTHKKRAPKKRAGKRRRNPGQQLSFTEIAAKHARAKPLRRRHSKKGAFISRIAKKKGKRYAPPRKKAPSSAARTMHKSTRFEQLTLDEALKSVNRRLIGARPIVVVAGAAPRSSSSSSGTKRKRKKAVRKAARKGGNMAKKRSGGKKRRKSSRGRRGHRRIRCIPYQRKGKWIARRVNPSLPAPVAALLGAGVGAAAGVGISYAADKLGLGSPTHRNWGLFGLGLLAAAAGHKFAPGASLAVGAGVAGIGLLRSAQTMLYAVPTATAPVSGLGSGDGGASDISSPFAQLGSGGSVFDRIGAVVDDVGALYE
jgi:hypothetical protein